MACNNESFQSIDNLIGKAYNLRAKPKGVCIYLTYDAEPSIHQPVCTNCKMEEFVV